MFERKLRCRPVAPVCQRQPMLSKKLQYLLQFLPTLLSRLLFLDIDARVGWGEYVDSVCLACARGVLC